ncbi:MAG: hypothetical protein DLM70_08880 [Chloroflexi bacterium]|nr:MAG: hypothetical protein DLM70_08880 [Chloroflexota bacterium]
MAKNISRAIAPDVPELKWSVDDVLAIVTDVFFQVRISGCARAAGRRVRYLKTDESIRTAADYVLVLVDLDAGLDVQAAIRYLASNSDAPIVAFGPHVDSEARKAARAAGAHRVLAKSKFVTELPVILSRDADPSERQGGQTARVPSPR